MHLASASVQTGLSPLSSIPPELVTEHGLVATFCTHALVECFPIGALRDSWTWRDLFTGEPLLIPLEERVSPLLLVDSSDSHTENIEYLPIVYTDNQIYAHSNATRLKE